MVHLLPLPRLFFDPPPHTQKTPSQMPVEWPSPLQAPPLGQGNTHSFPTSLPDGGGSHCRCNRSPSVQLQTSSARSDRVGLPSKSPLLLQAPSLLPGGSQSHRQLQGNDGVLDSTVGLRICIREPRKTPPSS